MSIKAVVQDLTCLYGSDERLAEVVSRRVAVIENERGIPAAASRSPVSPKTIHRLRTGRTEWPRWPVVAQALADLAGMAPHEMRSDRGSTDLVERREFLAGGVGAVALGMLRPLVAELGRPAPDIERYERRATELWQSAWTADPPALIHDAADHADYGQDLLGRAGGKDRDRTAAAAGLSTILVGRLSFFNLGRSDVAEAAWSQAARLLHGSPDHPLLACLYGHMAFVPGWAGRWGEAEQHLAVASRHARLAGGPGVRAWLHAVAAECLSASGRDRQELAVEEVRRAGDTLAAPAARPDPWWLDFFDASRLNGFDASVRLSAARRVLAGPGTAAAATRVATHRVESALGLLRTSSDNPAGYTAQDCVTVLDQAIGHGLLHDDDGALALAEDACQALGKRPYRAAESRLSDLADILPSAKAERLYEIERAYLAAA